MRIALTGASGFLGSALIHSLTRAGHTLHTAGRRRPAGSDVATFSLWEGAGSPFPRAALEGADAVIHLAGEPVAQRWTPAAKQSIRSSRVEGTRALVQALAARQPKPGILISASAIGYYGDRGEERLTEDSAAGSGFLPEVCVAWENAAREAEVLGIRVVRLRIGVVLGRGGGALEKMIPPFRFGLGGRMASGRQWMSWIHVQDVIGLILHALGAPGLSGPMNATAPHPVRNVDFTAELAHTLHRPALFGIPSFALKLAFGEMSSMLTGGQYVEPAVAARSGYRFEFPQLRAALQAVIAA